MHWDEAFWPTDLDWMAYMTPNDSSTGLYTGFLNPTAVNGGTPILIGWIGRDNAVEALSTNTDEEILQTALAKI